LTANTNQIQTEELYLKSF